MLGWLHAVPEGNKQSRMAVESWPMPEVGQMQYLLNWFFQLRMSFDYQDIVAWSTVTATYPNPVEVDILITMATIYSNSVITYRSKDHNLTPPYDGRTPEQIDNMIAEKMRRSMERFK